MQTSFANVNLNIMLMTAVCVCGVVGEIKELVRANFDIDEPVFLFELDLEALSKTQGVQKTYEPIPKFPASGRDLAVVVSEDVPVRDLIDLIRDTGEELLNAVTVFDVYRGEQVPSGMKSVAFSMTYLSPDRTLTDQEVTILHESIIEALAIKFSARLRDA